MLVEMFPHLSDLAIVSLSIQLGQYQWSKVFQDEDDTNKAEESSWRAKPSSPDEN